MTVMTEKQHAPDAPSVPLADARIADELRDVTRALLDDGSFGVYYYSDGRRVVGESWIIIERGGNVGTIQYERLGGYKVCFEIKPSRTAGSSLLVDVPNEDRDPLTVPELVECAYVATQDHYRNFATEGKALPNHGWEHFRWAAERLTQITGD